MNNQNNNTKNQILQVYINIGKLGQDQLKAIKNDYEEKLKLINNILNCNTCTTTFLEGMKGSMPEEKELYF